MLSFTFSGDLVQRRGPWSGVVSSNRLSATCVGILGVKDAAAEKRKQEYDARREEVLAKRGLASRNSSKKRVIPRLEQKRHEIVYVRYPNAVCHTTRNAFLRKNP